MNLEEKIFSHSIFDTAQNCMTIDKARVQALAYKAVRQGYDSETICRLLAEDSFFKAIKYKFGYKKAHSILKKIIKKAQS